MKETTPILTLHCHGPWFEGQLSSPILFLGDREIAYLCPDDFFPLFPEMKLLPTGIHPIRVTVEVDPNGPLLFGYCNDDDVQFRKLNGGYLKRFDADVCSECLPELYKHVLEIHDYLRVSVTIEVVQGVDDEGIAENVGGETSV